MTDPVLPESINEGDSGALPFFDHLAAFHNAYRLGDGSAHYVPADFFAADALRQPLDPDLTAIAALTTTTIGRSLLAAVDAAALRTILALGTAAVQNTGAFDASGAASAAQAASQPLDSDLTAIAALTTTSIGRSLLAAVDAAALRTILALGTAATQASTAFDAAGAASAAQSASISYTDAQVAGRQPLDSDLTAIAALSTTSFGRSLLALADAAAARTAIGASSSAVPSGRSVGGNTNLVDADIDNVVDITATGTATIGTITKAGVFFVYCQGSGIQVTVAGGANTLTGDVATPNNRLITQGRMMTVMPVNDLTHWRLSGAEQ